MAENKCNPALERLGVFVGEWNLEITSMSFRTDSAAVDDLSAGPIELETTRVIESPGVTHLQFRIVK